MAIKLTKQEIRFLLLADKWINDPINEYALFPESKWFEDRLYIGTQGVTNIKRRLLEKKFLDLIEGETRLSHLAKEFIAKRRIKHEPYSLEILTPGQVSAGDKSGELTVYANDINDYVSESVSIPGIDYTDKKVVAYEVVGDSMEEEKIFSGDYVIIEVNPDKALEVNRIIVTKYRKTDDEDDAYLKGPTLKAYKGEGRDPKGRKCHVLGWVGKNEKNNPYEIYAKEITPIGTVIGVYRPYPKKHQMESKLK